MRQRKGQRAAAGHPIRQSRYRMKETCRLWTAHDDWGLHRRWLMCLFRRVNSQDPLQVITARATSEPYDPALAETGHWLMKHEPARKRMHMVAFSSQSLGICCRCMYLSNCGSPVVLRWVFLFGSLAYNSGSGHRPFGLQLQLLYWSSRGNITFGFDTHHMWLVVVATIKSDVGHVMFSYPF